MKRTRKNFSLEKTTIEKIEKIAKTEKRTLSSVIDIAIHDYFKTKKYKLDVSKH